MKWVESGIKVLLFNLSSRIPIDGEVTWKSCDCRICFRAKIWACDTQIAKQEYDAT
jgi:hypothetical protein